MMMGCVWDLGMMLVQIPNSPQLFFQYLFLEFIQKILKKVNKHFIKKRLNSKFGIGNIGRSTSLYWWITYRVIGNLPLFSNLKCLFIKNFWPLFSWRQRGGDALVNGVELGWFLSWWGFKPWCWCIFFQFFFLI